MHWHGPTTSKGAKIGDRYLLARSVYNCMFQCTVHRIQLVIVLHVNYLQSIQTPWVLRKTSRRRPAGNKLVGLSYGLLLRNFMQMLYNVLLKPCQQLMYQACLSSYLWVSIMNDKTIRIDSFPGRHLTLSTCLQPGCRCKFSLRRAIKILRSS